MKKSSAALDTVLAELRQRAHDRGLSNSQWAQRAGVRKETLSRLRGRPSCDFGTLQALARVVDAQLQVSKVKYGSLTDDGHFPAIVDRDYEDELLRLCASGDLSRARWEALGPGFFMAGLAVMLGSVRGLDRRGLLALADELHPGVTEPAVFNLWLERSPVRASRFFPALEMTLRHAA